MPSKRWVRDDSEDSIQFEQRRPTKKNPAKEGETHRQGKPIQIKRVKAEHGSIVYDYAVKGKHQWLKCPCKSCQDFRDEVAPTP